MTPSPQDTLPLRARIGRRLAAAATAFLLLVSLTMTANAWLLRTANPLDTPALRALLARLDQSPADEALREQVRELDWMARRAFFVRQGQLRSGAYLLAGGLLVLLAGLQLALFAQPPSPRPATCPGLDSPWQAAARARKLLVAGFALLCALAWGATLLCGKRSRIPETAPPSTTPDPSAAAPPHASASLAPSLPPATAWPAFRGDRSLGVAREADPPLAWNGATGEGVLWKSPVPRSGFSSPVVWEDRIFLTGADAQAREVFCFSASNGTLLWSASTEGATEDPETLPQVTADTGYAAPSVATDGQRVAAIFGTGVVLCLDAEGRLLWARNLGVPQNPYGHSSSLLLLDSTLYLQFDHAGESALLALDAETGQERWRRVRSANASWASPILVEQEGLRLLVLAANEVCAYEALTGALRWSRDLLYGEIGSSPAYADGRVFFANQYACAAALDAADGTLLWSLADLELPDAGSPVATAHHLFLPTSYGEFSCLDASDGNLLWQQTFDTGGYGSPVLAGGRVYWVTQDGTTRIFRAADTFELLAEPPLGEASACTPAAVGRRLYLRGTTHLFCLGEE